MTMSSEFKVTGVVLAGGQGRRMGEQDKGFITLAGEPLIKHIVTALRPQCNTIIINANRNMVRYAEYGYEVLSDQQTGFQGPLAGMAAVMKHASDEWIITVPCDAPFVAPDYVLRMQNAVCLNGADIAVARDKKRLQPVYALIRVKLLADLGAYLKAGERKIDLWFQRHKLIEVDFTDAASMFENFNTPEQLQAYQAAHQRQQ